MLALLRYSLAKHNKNELISLVLITHEQRYQLDHEKLSNLSSLLYRTIDFTGKLQGSNTEAKKE